MRRSATQRQARAGCGVCHDGAAAWTGGNAQAVAARHHDATGHPTWCEIHLSVTYGHAAVDERQTDIEDAIAASSGERPVSLPVPDSDAPAVAPAGVSAPQGRPVETPASMRDGARGRKPETVHV